MFIFVLGVEVHRVPTSKKFCGKKVPSLQWVVVEKLFKMSGLTTTVDPEVKSPYSLPSETAATEQQFSHL